MKLLLEFIFEIALTYQITQIICESVVCEPLREYFQKWALVGNKIAIFIYKLISCFLCTSVWVSVIVSSIFINIPEYLGYSHLNPLTGGLALSFFVWFVRLYEGKLTA